MVSQNEQVVRFSIDATAGVGDERQTLSRTYTLRGAATPQIAPIKFAEELNPQQYDAVKSPGGATLVIAGAGSGKTRTLTYRVAYLLSQGVKPWEILLLTFTNKASREMLDRVATLVPGHSEGIWGGTFHSIGNRILRKHAERIGFRQGFSIMDRDDSEDLIEASVTSLGLDSGDRRFPKGSVLADIFSLSVNTGRPVQSLLSEKYTYFIPLAEEIEAAQAAYETRKKETNSMDFDDLLTKVLELFLMCPEVAAEYQQRFHHVLVDEYQDTNRIQSELVEAFSHKHRNLMVVGDDAQSIYSWRGADFENILRFPKKHPDACVFKIETNYRSVPQVLEVANASILANERQFPKNLAPVRAAHSVKPALVCLATNNQQAAFVAQRIRELSDDGISLNDIAVLYRAHYHSMEIQLELTRHGIPFAITSGLRFFEQAHIKDTASFLKLAVNPSDEISFKRLVRLLPGIGEKSAHSLWEQASAALGGRPDFAILHNLKVPAKAAKSWRQLADTLIELAANGSPRPPAEMIEAVMFAIYDEILKEKFPNYENRKEDLGTLISYARQFADTGEFLSQLSLVSGVETSEELGMETTEGKVTLSTIHQAKGLEWKVVFLVWLTDGMFPNAKASEQEAGLEEERRLFYVGVTRCMDELYLTYPAMRLNAGYGDAFQRPSPFLQEIPEHLLETWEITGESEDEEDLPF